MPKFTIIHIFIVFIISKLFISIVSKHFNAFDEENFNDMIERRSDDPDEEHNEYSSFSQSDQIPIRDRLYQRDESVSRIAGSI